MIYLDSCYSIVGSFKTVVECCRIADKMGEDVTIDIYGCRLILHPGDNPHVRYKEYNPVMPKEKPG